MNGAGPAVGSLGFREIEHSSDRAYRIWGTDLGALFSSGARALYDLAGIGAKSGARVERGIEVTGFDQESLLVAWLNELLFLLVARGEVFQQFEFQELGGRHLRARGVGVVCTEAWQDIKAATYHSLAIHPTERGLEATVVFDV